MVFHSREPKAYVALARALSCGIRSPVEVRAVIAHRISGEPDAGFPVPWPVYGSPCGNSGELFRCNALRHSQVLISAWRPLPALKSAAPLARLIGYLPL